MVSTVFDTHPTNTTSSKKDLIFIIECQSTMGLETR
jgi:hypothetical protein